MKTRIDSEMHVHANGYHSNHYKYNVYLSNMYMYPQKTMKTERKKKKEKLRCNTLVSPTPGCEPMEV